MVFASEEKMTMMRRDVGGGNAKPRSRGFSSCVRREFVNILVHRLIAFLMRSLSPVIRTRHDLSSHSTLLLLLVDLYRSNVNRSRDVSS